MLAIPDIDDNGFISNIRVNKNRFYILIPYGIPRKSHIFIIIYVYFEGRNAYCFILFSLILYIYRRKIIRNLICHLSGKKK